MPSSATQEWLDKAGEDYRAVAILAAEPELCGVAAYHAQQAAEKFIKAALVQAGIVPTRTHDLTALLARYPSSVPGEVEEAAMDLTGFAWITRYPGAPPLTPEQVEHARTLLETVKVWATEATASV